MTYPYTVLLGGTVMIVIVVHFIVQFYLRTDVIKRQGGQVQSRDVVDAFISEIPSVGDRRHLNALGLEAGCMLVIGPSTLLR